MANSQPHTLGALGDDIQVLLYYRSLLGQFLMFQQTFLNTWVVQLLLSHSIYLTQFVSNSTLLFKTMYKTSFIRLLYVYCLAFSILGPIYFRNQDFSSNSPPDNHNPLFIVSSLVTIIQLFPLLPLPWDWLPHLETSSPLYWVIPSVWDVASWMQTSHWRSNQYKFVDALLLTLLSLYILYLYAFKYSIQYFCLLLLTCLTPAVLFIS